MAVMSVHWDFPSNVNVKKKQLKAACFWAADAHQSCRINQMTSEIRAKQNQIKLIIYYSK